MPRFFFHTTNGKVTTDAEGIELPDTSSAQTMAIRLAGELLHGTPQLLRETTDLKVEVTDEEAVELFTVLVSVSNSPAGQKANDA